MKLKVIGEIHLVYDIAGEIRLVKKLEPEHQLIDTYKQYARDASRPGDLYVEALSKR